MTLFLSKPEDVLLAESRGIASIDLNISILLVKEEVEKVILALRQIKPWDIWLPNAYNQSVPVHQGTFVLKLRGHSWSYICQPFVSQQPMFLSQAEGLTLSNLLSTELIYYAASDTGGWFRYSFFKQGQMLEELAFEYSDEGGTTEFQSQISQITEEEIENAYGYTLEFLRNRDAYIPDLMMPYFVSEEDIKRQVLFNIENLEPSDIDRIDYLAQTTV